MCHLQIEEKRSSSWALDKQAEDKTFMPEPHHRALAPVSCEAGSAALKSVIVWKQYPGLGPGTPTPIEHSAWINYPTPSSEGVCFAFQW